jgi:Ca-activated chloride channel family protein
MKNKTNFYDRLGIPENASADEIKRAYRRMARQIHPDVNIAAGATERFLDIKEAYETLSDSQSRAAYDANNPQPNKARHPVGLNTHYSHTALVISQEKQLLYALIDMQIIPDSGLEPSPPPLNLALVLDVSTSMQGERLDMVKATAIELIRGMRPKDIVSIVSFNDRAQIPIQANYNINVRQAERDIHALHAQGGTEIYRGLEAGYKQVQTYLKPYNTNHIILITDGNTYGDEQACKKLADTAASEGIGISSLGIGDAWNDDLLDDLAARTGGSCIFVRRPEDINLLLKRKLNRLEQAYAERIQFNFKTGPNVTLRYAFQLKPEVGALSIASPLRLGSLGIGRRQRIILELCIDPLSADVEQVLLIDGEFRFDIPSKASAFRTPVTLTRPTQRQPSTQAPPADIIKALSKLTLYRMQEQAQKELSQGNYHKATLRLKHLSTHLLSQGAPGLSGIALEEAQRINKTRQLSAAGKKQIKYGTRALLLPEGN